MYLKEKIILSEIKCGECGKRFFELRRRPLDHCPHCKKELSFFNSETIKEKAVEVGIDVHTGAAQILKTMKKRNDDK